MLSTDEVRDFI